MALVLAKKNNGVTLLELLLAGALLGGLLLAATSFYVTGYKHFESESTSYLSQADVMMALERITRTASLGNSFNISDGGRQIKVRLDYNAALAPNNGGLGDSDVTNDTWFKYRFIEEPAASGQYRLRWRSDTNANAGTDVTTASSLELYPGIIFTAASGFLASPTMPTASFSMNLVANLGSVAIPRIMTMNTGVMLQGATQ